MDYTAMRAKLERLATLDWPAEWGDKEQAAYGDYHGWCHRYRFEGAASEDEIAAFERAYGVQLPPDYRRFLIEIGNGGPGPYFGIYPMGEGEDEAQPEEILQALHQPFALSEAWNDQSLLDRPEQYYGYAQMAGALPICTQGCALDYWLVISGPQAGQIWLDKRTDNQGVEPVLDSKTNEVLTFAPWYERWLDEIYAHHFGQE